MSFFFSNSSPSQINRAYAPDYLYRDKVEVNSNDNYKKSHCNDDSLFFSFKY